MSPEEAKQDRSEASRFLALNQRAKVIFQEIVNGFLETGEPVGSRGIASQISERISPATVRNVMADLEAMNLIHAPHTSAGRLPTQAGMRIFVDSLLEISSLDDDKKQVIDQCSERSADLGLEELLSGLSRLISDISQSACVVATDKQNSPIRQVEFVRLNQEQVMVVLVSQDGMVENRVVQVAPNLDESGLREAANWVNHHAFGRTIEEARKAITSQMDEEQGVLDRLVSGLITSGVAAWTSLGASRQLIVRGQANLFSSPEIAQDLEKARLLLQDLEAKESIASLLAGIDAGEGVRIFIGAENQLYSLSDSSVIAAPFRNESKEVIGAIGVIGPTRLNYASVIPMVDYTAQVVSEYIRKRRN